MPASRLEVESGDGPPSVVTTPSPLVVDELQAARSDHFVFDDNDARRLDVLPEHPFTTFQHELIALSQAQATTHNNNAAPPPQKPQFDPQALLNPKSPNTKRPASSGGDPDRGRTDATTAGQVSLVERLHNVQERTASPAKRVKTEDPRNKKNGTSSNFGGGSALELQNSTAQPLAFQSGPSIDLTLSKFRVFQSSSSTS
jgi:hypothetical protein